MLLKRFYHDGLAQASYLVGCQDAGVAIVVDPTRDAQQYVDAARAEGVRITHVTETHIHADYASGSRELARRCDAELVVSGEGGPEWQYTFAAADGATLVRDRSVLHVGSVRIDVRHTPGHTPEHLTFLVTDTSASDRPLGALTGDFIFVGDVGRPDLLERAARKEGTMRAAARELFHSLQRTRQLPDYLQLWPGHGAGSACGKALGAVPQSTLGYERLVNWAFQVDDEEEFVERVLAGQPEPPPYFARMKNVNRDGVPILGQLPAPEHHDAAVLPPILGDGGLVVDTRPTAAFAMRHVPGTINVPFNKSFVGYAGWLLPYDRQIFLLTAGDDDAQARGVARDLALIGMDTVAGFFAADDALTVWGGSGRVTETVAQTTVEELAAARRNGGLELVDVRAAGEWEHGHIPGARHIPLGHVPDEASSLPRDRTVVLHCQTGGRSAIAASLLLARGFSNVANLQGGFAAWEKAGLAVER